MADKNKKRIIILGAGALGSQLVTSLLPDLRGEVRITILDFDEIEGRNIEASTQFFLKEQLGMKKTEALQYNLNKWFNRRVEILTEKLTEENVSLLADYDLIVDTFDNYHSRKLVQDFVTKNKVECLHCGFSELTTFEVLWADNYNVPSDMTSDFDICEMAGAASFIRLAAAIGASAVLVYIKEGKKKEFVGNRFSVREIN